MRVILICLGLLGVVFGGEVTIRPGQTLNIGVTGVAVSEKGRLDNNYSVSKEGKVTMWKIGPVQAAGKTKRTLPLNESLISARNHCECLLLLKSQISFVAMHLK